MLKLVPTTISNLSDYFRVRGIKAERISLLRREICSELGISHLLGSADLDMSSSREISRDFLLIVKSFFCCWKWQYRSSEIVQVDGEWKVSDICELKEGFTDFDSNEVSFILSELIRGGESFQIICTPAHSISIPDLINADAEDLRNSL